MHWVRHINQNLIIRRYNTEYGIWDLKFWAKLGLFWDHFWTFLGLLSLFSWKGRRKNAIKAKNALSRLCSIQNISVDMRLKPRDIQAPKIMVTVSMTRWRRSSRKTPDLWNFFEEPRSVLGTLLLYQILLEVMSLQCNPTIISWTQNYKSSRRTSSWRRRGGGW